MHASWLARSSFRHFIHVWPSTYISQSVTHYMGLLHIITLHWPSKHTCPLIPLNILQVGPTAEVLAVLSLKVQMLVVPGVALNVNTVFTEIELFDEAIVSIARALQAIRLTVVNVDLVVHRTDRKCCSSRVEFRILNPVP